MLQSLFLEDNPLDSIPNLRVLSGSLRQLRVGGEAIPAIPANAFQGLSQVSILNISRAGTASFHRDALDGTKVDDIYLGDNSFSAIPDFGSRGSYIRILDMSKNLIKTIGDNVLVSMTSLTKLILAGCPLTQLAPRALCGTVISTLDLTATMITEISDLRAIANTVSTLKFSNTKVR